MTDDLVARLRVWGLAALELPGTRIKLIKDLHAAADRIEADAVRINMLDAVSKMAAEHADSRADRIEALQDALKKATDHGDNMADCLLYATEWRPIETAPKDGTWFLIVNATDGCESMECGRYDPMMMERFVGAGDGLYRKEMQSVMDWRGFNNIHRATHWLPLPQPPRGDNAD